MRKLDREVILNDNEQAVARLIAERRLDQALREGRRDTLGIDSLKSHMMGVMGEMAFAKAANIYWPASVGTFKTQRDVGEFEIRTRSTKNGELIIRKNDDKKAVFVLVNALGAGWFRISGWTPAERWIVSGLVEGSPFYRTDRGTPHAWFIPQEQLFQFNYNEHAMRAPDSSIFG